MKKTVFLCMLALPAIALANDRFVEETFEVSEDARLELECHKGEIRIETGDVSAIQMKARIYPDQGPIEDLQYVEIRTSQGDRRVNIEVEYDTNAMDSGEKKDSGLLSSWDGTSLPFVDFEIIVPRGASLDLESHKSSFDIQSPSGRIEIETHKGRGRVTGVRDHFQLSTHKGEFEVEIEEMGDIDIETHKGRVNVIVNGASDFRLRGETHKGDLDFEGRDVQVRRDGDDGYWVSETFGTGEHMISLDTHKGRIMLDFRN